MSPQNNTINLVGNMSWPLCFLSNAWYGATCAQNFHCPLFIRHVTSGERNDNKSSVDEDCVGEVLGNANRIPVMEFDEADT